MISADEYSGCAAFRPELMKVAAMRTFIPDHFLIIVLSLLFGVRPDNSAAATMGDDSQISPTEVTVEFQVSLSEHAALPWKTGEQSEGVKNTADLFIAGDDPKLGRWSPRGLPLIKGDDHVFRARLTFPEGADFRFKVTRGSWDTVEKRNRGQERPNRRFRVTSPNGRDVLKVNVLVEAWADQDADKQTDHPGSTVSGTLVLHREINSRVLQKSRTVAVWLPPGYQESSDRYPVFYLMDGQNLFDAATSAFGVEWQADETAMRLIEQKRIPPLILVGVWNTADRIEDYTPDRDELYRRGGNADVFLEFLCEDLKPYIDQTYRTRTEAHWTAIGGSSLGGLFALYAGQQRPEIFARCAAISPSLGWADERQLIQIEKTSASAFAGIHRLWVDMGDSEGTDSDMRNRNADRLRRLERCLSAMRRTPLSDAEDRIPGSIRSDTDDLRDDHESSRGWRCVVVPDAGHDEHAWSERFGDILEFLWADEPPSESDRQHSVRQ